MTIQLNPKLRKLFPVWSKLPSFSNFDKCEKQIIFKEIPGTIYKITYTLENIQFQAFVFLKHFSIENKNGYVIKSIQLPPADFAFRKKFITILVGVDNLFSKKQTYEIYKSFEDVKKALYSKPQINNIKIVEMKGNVQQITLRVHNTIEFDLLYRLTFNEKVINIVLDYISSIDGVLYYKALSTEVGLQTSEDFISLKPNVIQTLIKKLETLKEFKVLSTQYNEETFKAPRLQQADPHFYDLIMDIFLSSSDYNIEMFNNDKLFFYLYEDIINVLIGKTTKNSIDIMETKKMTLIIQKFLYSMSLFILNKRARIYHHFFRKIPSKALKNETYIYWFIDGLYASTDMNVLKKELKTNLLEVMDMSQYILKVLQHQDIIHKEELLATLQLVHLQVVRVLKLLN